MLSAIMRLLNRQVTVGGTLETMLYFVFAYLVVGFVVTFFHMEYVNMLADQWAHWMPAGAQIAALIQITVMWPGLLLTSHLCMT
jgi:hypothetical protein